MQTCSSSDAASWRSLWAACGRTSTASFSDRPVLSSACNGACICAASQPGSPDRGLINGQEAFMVLLLALGLAGALAQTQGGDAGAATTGTVVSGRVVEQGTGAPVGGAQVIALPMLQGPRPAGSFPMRPRTVMTDDGGRF